MPEYIFIDTDPELDWLNTPIYSDEELESMYDSYFKKNPSGPKIDIPDKDLPF